MSTATEKKPTSRLEKIYTTLFAAGLVLGAGLLAAERWGGPGVVLGGLSILCFGLGMVILAWSSARIGSARLRSRRVYRTERPVVFWTVVGVRVVAGAVMAFGGVWILVTKA